MPIFDQGYQHWQGELGGNLARWRAITLQGLRVGFKNRYLRTVLYLAWMPAFALVITLCVWGMVERNSDYIKFLLSTLERMLGQTILEAPRNYRVEVWTISYHFFLLIEMYYAMLLILMVGPNLISQDLRFNALPLYLSRPLSRIDYFIGKLGVITVLLGMIVIIPSIVAYVAGLLFSADISIIRDTYRLLFASLAYGIIISLSGGMLILALSSLSRNSRYVAAFWIALIMVGSVVYSVLSEAHRHEIRNAQQSISFATSEDEATWQLEVAKSNWRPLVSYTGNLSCIGQELLGVDKCWQRISESWRARERRRFLALVSGPQYPWYWSAIVLTFLFALSAWVLKRQVKSLDRLKIAPIVEFHNVSKWYGNVIGVNKLTLRIPAGVTGLLGPNGAGKSTLLQLATGQLYPSQGTVQVLGQRVWNNSGLNRFIGLCPEQDAFYEWMTGFDFVQTCARLSGMGGRAAKDAANRALAAVSMTNNQNRPVRGYSKGMRQRTKLAQALVHDPKVLFLDEPLTGTDPVVRRDLMDIIQRLGSEGKSVLVSSHVLHEVQSLTPNIVLLNHGRLLAEGNIRQIRDLIDHHPHHIVLVCDDFRRLAGKLVARADVEGVKVNAKDRSLVVETRTPDAFYSSLPELVLTDGLEIRELYSDDDNLEAVFKYLVNR